MEYVVSVEEEFLATGMCPSHAPDVVVSMDGTEHKANALSLPAHASYSVDGFRVKATHSMLDWKSLSPSSLSGCSGLTSEFYSRPSAGEIGVSVGVFFDPPQSPPFFVSSISATSLDHANYATPYAPVERDGEATVVYASPDLETGSYMWLCTNSVPGPADYEVGPTEWSGSLFIHVEEWLQTDGAPYATAAGEASPPTDLFFEIGSVDCAFGEDASWNTGDCYNWSEQDCDGIDNDLDGIVDEGSKDDLDQDGNGVPDCMDDWDGDGIPNAEDPDLDHGVCDDI